MRINAADYITAIQKQQSQGVAVYHLDNLPDADPKLAREATETLWKNDEAGQKILWAVPVGATVRLIELAKATGIKPRNVNNRLCGSTRFQKVSRGYYKRLY